VPSNPQTSNVEVGLEFSDKYRHTDDNRLGYVRSRMQMKMIEFCPTDLYAAEREMEGQIAILKANLGWDSHPRRKSFLDIVDPKSKKKKKSKAKSKTAKSTAEALTKRRAKELDRPKASFKSKEFIDDEDDDDDDPLGCLLYRHASSPGSTATSSQRRRTNNRRRAYPGT